MLHVLRPRDPILLTLKTLVHKDLLLEKALHLLVGHVDAQLLKAVGLQGFEPWHVQYPQDKASVAAKN
jgi:hypothetical protein